MTFGEAKTLLDDYLRGDASGSSSSVTAAVLTQAVNEVSRRTKPPPLLAEWDDTKTDVLRRVESVADEDTGDYVHWYIQKPDFSALDDNTALPVPEELGLAVVYFLCSYFTAMDRGRYVNAAEEIVAQYDTNAVDPNDYKNDE